MFRNCRQGLTLVEVLVVFFLLCVLVAFMLPAQQAARSTARSEASNELKQLGAEPENANHYSRNKGLLLADASLPEAQEIKSMAPRDSQRIIYEASIGLVVSDFVTTEQKLSRLVQEQKGFLANANVNRRQGERISGNWRARIPVENYNVFLDALTQLGIAETQKQTAQDVTEEFVDLEARIKNKRQLEDRIIQLLEKSDDKITDMIQIERELARVRGEIEQMEGRLRYLSNRTELTTVNISVREEVNYVPPSTPSYTERIASAWNGSLETLKDFGKNASVRFVYVFPWLLIGSVLLMPTIWFLLRLRKRATGQESE